MFLGKDFARKMFLFVAFILVSAIQVYAASTSLDGVEVIQNSNGYGIILKLEGNNTKIKKTINSPHSLTLTLNSTTPSGNMEIFYDNTSGLNNVAVQKNNTGTTAVTIEGQNISNSAVYTKNAVSGVLMPVETNSEFFTTNLKITSFLVILMILGFILSLFNKTKKVQIKQNNIRQVNSLITQETIPSIGYKVQKGYSAVPKDFIINRYLENEKMKKVG